MLMDDTYTYDEICTIRIYEGLPEAKTALKEVEFTLASVRARGGHLIKFLHDESLGSSRNRLREEVRRLLRAARKEGRIVLMIPGEDFSMADSATRYLVDRVPVVEFDRDMEKKNGNMTVVYF